MEIFVFLFRCIPNSLTMWSRPCLILKTEQSLPWMPPVRTARKSTVVFNILKTTINFFHYTILLLKNQIWLNLYLNEFSFGPFQA